MSAKIIFRELLWQQAALIRHEAATRRFAPTTIGWSEVTWIVYATFVNASGLATGIVHVRFRVWAAASE